MNYPKILLEKYALVKEDNKEDILAGLEEVEKDRELYNLFKSISGVRGMVAAEEKQLWWYIDRVEEEAIATWLWDQGIWRREAERIWDTMPQDEKNEITIKKIEKWISDNPDIKNEICPNITIEDVERLLRDYPDNMLDESEKDDILSGLEELGGSLHQDLLDNGFRLAYKTEAVAYYTKYIYAHDTKKKLYQINIVAYEPGTSFWPVTGPQQVDYNKTHYFAKIELSSLEYKTLMEVKTAADIKLAEQKAKDLWEGKYTTPIQEDKDKEDIMAGLEELDAKNRIYLEFYNTKSLEELIELVEKYRYVLRNFHEHEKVDSISNYIAGLNHELWLAIAWANIYIKRKGGILDWNPNLSGVVGAYKLAVSNYDEFLAKKSQEKKEINESDKEDILAGLDYLAPYLGSVDSILRAIPVSFEVLLEIGRAHV